MRLGLCSAFSACTHALGLCVPGAFHPLHRQCAACPLRACPAPCRRPPPCRLPLPRPPPCRPPLPRPPPCRPPLPCPPLPPPGNPPQWSRCRAAATAWECTLPTCPILCSPARRWTGRRSSAAPPVCAWSSSALPGSHLGCQGSTWALFHAAQQGVCCATRQLCLPAHARVCAPPARRPPCPRSSSRAAPLLCHTLLFPSFAPHPRLQSTWWIG